MTFRSAAPIQTYYPQSTVASGRGRARMAGQAAASERRNCFSIFASARWSLMVLPVVTTTPLGCCHTRWRLCRTSINPNLAAMGAIVSRRAMVGDAVAGVSISWGRCPLVVVREGGQGGDRLIMMHLCCLGGDDRGRHTPVDELRGAPVSILELICPPDPFDLTGLEIGAHSEREQGHGSFRLVDGLILDGRGHRLPPAVPL